MIIFLKRYQLPIYAVPFILGTTCNVILIIIIICNKDMQTVPNMYILNLATSDIIYLTILFSHQLDTQLKPPESTGQVLQGKPDHDVTWIVHY
jgi:hypothetical protein